MDRQFPRLGTDEAARAACRTAFDGLAENARNDHRPRDAEAALDRGLRELPADAAYFHLQLGRHYHDVGRIGLAVEHLETAVRLDRATFEAPAGDLIRQIRTATPGCFSGIIR